MVTVPPALRRAARRAAGELARVAARAARDALRSGGDAGNTDATRAPQRADARRGPPVASATAVPRVEYAPARDGDADPGEVVWTWVPYEEDASRGKDRPVLVVGRLGEDVAALALTSRPHADADHHALGVWDQRDGRPSWVRLDRVLRLDPDGIRREGAVLPRDRFDDVVEAWQANARR